MRLILSQFAVNLVVARMPANLFIAGLDINLVKHVLSPQCLGDAFGLVLSQRMFGIDARDFKNPFIDTHDSERPERHT